MAIPKVRLQLSTRLRQLRIKYGFTQEEMAEKGGLDARYYQRLESRKPPAIKIDTLDRLARALEIPCSQLLNF